MMFGELLVLTDSPWPLFGPRKFRLWQDPAKSDRPWAVNECVVLPMWICIIITIIVIMCSRPTLGTFCVLYWSGGRNKIIVHGGTNKHILLKYTSLLQMSYLFLPYASLLKHWRVEAKPKVEFEIDFEIHVKRFVRVHTIVCRSKPHSLM